MFIDAELHGSREPEGAGEDVRTGSHNVVVGQFLNYSASGIFAVVSGGRENTASGEMPTVSGGYGNTASGHYAAVSGGQSNTATGRNAAVSGGVFNTAGSVAIFI